jgi:hypothetical protein
MSKHLTTLLAALVCAATLSGVAGIASSSALAGDTGSTTGTTSSGLFPGPSTSPSFDPACC